MRDEKNQQIPMSFMPQFSTLDPRRSTMTTIPSEQRRRSRRRRGFFSMELALTLPILGILLFGLLEFSLLFFARGSVVEASRIGARAASLPGVTAADVRAAVSKVLNPRLQQTARVDVSLGGHSGDIVVVAVAVPMKSASPDLLWPIGLGLGKRLIYAETRMVKE